MHLLKNNKIMTTTSSTYGSLEYSKILGVEKDISLIALSSTADSNLNSSHDNLVVSDSLKARLDFNEQREQLPRKSSAPTPEALVLSLNPVNKGDRRRNSYIDILIHKGLLPK